MKLKNLIKVLMLIAISANSASAQWTTSGSIVYLTDSNKNVSVGTLTNAANFYVQKQASVNLGIKSVTGSGTMFMDRGTANANAAFAYKSQGTTLWNSGLIGNNNFSIKNITTGSNIFVITTANNVGIGNTSPAEKLSITGNQIISARLGLPVVNGVTKLNIEDTHASDAFLRMVNTTKGPNISWVGFGTSGDWTLRSCSNSGVVGLQDQIDGRIGLGTTNPSTGAKTELFGQIGIATAVLTSPLIGQVQSWIHYGSTGDWYIRSALTTGKVIIQDLGGQVCIGTTTPATGYKLSVYGKVMAEELKVQLKASWPDYVFDDTYELKSLSATEQFIKQNKHLPGIPSAQEMIDNGGIEVGDMQIKLLQKIEELTLHVIELEKELNQIKNK